MRCLLSLAAALVLPALASAQCFEPSFGTSLGIGDDNVYPATPASMGITFPMGGVAASYTTIKASTNGAIFLSNGVDIGSSTAFSATTASLQGVAGNGPRLAPYWQDLNLLAANSAGLFLNNTIPGKCVLTWVNAVHFGQTTPVFTFQAQLFSDGRVSYFYSPNMQNTATTPIVGVCQANGIAPIPAAVNLSAGSVGVSTSQFVYQTFPTLNTFNSQLGGKTVTFIPNGGGGYDVSTITCVATNSSYGAGCYNTFASFYENFATAGAFDLGGTSLSLTNTGTGYVVSASGASFVPPVSPTVLVLSDDSEAITPAMTTPFPYPGGSTSAFAVCSNGFISAATGNGTGFSPSVPTMLAATQTGWWNWHDYNPGIVGSGQVKFEEIAGIAYVTWDGVWDFGGSSAANASNVQWQFDEATGNINVVFGTMSTLGNGFLLGYSPGGASLDPGSRDVSATVPFVTAATDSPALALACAPAPVLGATVTWTTSNIPGGVVVSGHILSFGQFNPGIDLTGLGAPGCFQFVDLSTSATALLFGSPTATNSLFIPNVPAYAGTNLYAQSISLVPGINALGVVTSNGVRTFINTF